MKRNLAFTLVELLAVIVILAIVLAIAVPSITGVINSSTRNAFLSDAKMVIKAIDYKLLEDDAFDVTTINETNIESLLGISDDNYTSVEVVLENNKPKVVIIGKNKWDGLMAFGISSNMAILDSADYVEDFSYSKGVNKPKLASGMTPIKWNGTSWVETTENDNDWYSYDTTNKKWANAKSENGSMWVWIPRYAYKISSGWHSSTTGTIDISFSMGTDDTRGGTVTLDTGTTSEASNNKWTNHPAFTFGNDEVTGMWVAKFEVDGDINDEGFIFAKPNRHSYLGVDPEDAFNACRSMETNTIYGWGTTGSGIDTHLTKNVEWGAIAYLSKSVYGKNDEEVWINPANDYTTGCAGDSVSSSATTGCLNTYETPNGVKASTTGTIYGIYDTRGGASDLIAAYTEEGAGAYGLSIINADAKYKDVYTEDGEVDPEVTYGLTINKKGDALYETSVSDLGSNAWFNDKSGMAYFESSIFIRGGGYGWTTSSGVFAFENIDGSSTASVSFRPILLVGEGL